MNVAYFLIPKISVAYLQDDDSVRQSLEKMKYHGYTSIPVISREGVYVNTVSEGDFLWYILGDKKELQASSLKEMEEISLKEVLRRDRNPPVLITATMEELLKRFTNQNFIPVIDDRQVFIGIVTRRQIIQYYCQLSNGGEKAEGPDTGS